ncbi:MAG TPA: guanylate kinase [Terriglobales bacterium]|nr:guanylate kinase [Terriglobales bacterium]
MSKVYIISAPSGSGKSTLVDELRKSVHNLDFSISYTTRSPRGSERDGCEYYFVSVDRFEEMIRRDEFLEHANVFGNYYGTAKRFLTEAKEAGHDLLLDIDVQGAAQVKQKIQDAVSIFVLPPDKPTLEQRLRRRSLDSDQVIQRRLIGAAKEIENYHFYDYILINDRLEQSIDELRAIFLAERLPRSRADLSPKEAEIVAKASRSLLPNIRERLQPILASFALSATHR